MQLRILGSRGLPEGSLVSVRVGATRRQATLGSDKPYRFPEANGVQAMKVDIYAPVASTRLNIDQAEKTFTLPLLSSGGNWLPNVKDNNAMSIDVQVGGSNFDTMNQQVEEPITENINDTKISRPPTASTRPSTAQTSRNERSGTSLARFRHHVALEAQPYFEKHCLIDVIQSVLQAVIKERPNDPFGYMINVLENTKKGVASPQESPCRGQTPSPKLESILTQPAKEQGACSPPKDDSPYKPPIRARPQSAMPGSRKSGSSAAVSVEQPPLAQDSPAGQAPSDSTRSPSCAPVVEESLPSPEHTAEHTPLPLHPNGLSSEVDDAAAAAAEASENLIPVLPGLPDVDSGNSRFDSLAQTLQAEDVVEDGEVTQDVPLNCAEDTTVAGFSSIAVTTLTCQPQTAEDSNAETLKHSDIISAVASHAVVEDEADFDQLGETGGVDKLDASATAEFTTSLAVHAEAEETPLAEEVIDSANEAAEDARAADVVLPKLAAADICAKGDIAHEDPEPGERSLMSCSLTTPWPAEAAGSALAEVVAKIAEGEASAPEEAALKPPPIPEASPGSASSAAAKAEADMPLPKQVADESFRQPASSSEEAAQVQASLPDPGSIMVCSFGGCSAHSDIADSGTVVSHAHRQVMSYAADEVEREIWADLANAMPPAHSGEPSIAPSVTMDPPLPPEVHNMGQVLISMEDLRKRLRDGLEAAADAGTLPSLILQAEVLAAEPTC